MKTDLATSILAAIVGTVLAYFIVNIFLPPIESFTFSTLSGTNNYSLTEPDEDIFNFRALNPTVEVYVGDCTNYSETGECLDDVRSSGVQEAPVEEVLKESPVEESADGPENNASEGA
ncbi:MAG: hypothetical protein Q4B29_00280 [Candidatus Saccharibacteria bacterium]|nr:hypothetical protein [Candidatus Saccharibacteria bacterium]